MSVPHASWQEQLGLGSSRLCGQASNVGQEYSAWLIAAHWTALHGIALPYLQKQRLDRGLCHRPCIPQECLPAPYYAEAEQHQQKRMRRGQRAGARERRSGQSREALGKVERPDRHAVRVVEPVGLPPLSVGVQHQPARAERTVGTALVRRARPARSTAARATTAPGAAVRAGLRLQPPYERRPVAAAPRRLGRHEVVHKQVSAVRGPAL